MKNGGKELQLSTENSSKESSGGLTEIASAHQDRSLGFSPQRTVPFTNITMIRSLILNKVRSRRRRKNAERLCADIRRLPKLANPFIVIVMPGGLHLADLAIKLIPQSHDCVVILNGSSEIEREWSLGHFANRHVIYVAEKMGHAKVLDLLFDSFQQDFGVMDYDCYVLDSTLFDRISRIDSRTAMNGCFFRRQPELQLDSPETFLLYFNLTRINQLRERYGIGARKRYWKDVPTSVRDRLSQLGLCEHTFPEQHKPYYDTLRLLMMLSICDEVPYKLVEHLHVSPSPSSTAFHVGGVSRPGDAQEIWQLRGSYFWYRVLESTPESPLAAYYRRLYPPTDSESLLRANPAVAEHIKDEFFEMCDEIIQRGQESDRYAI